MNKYVVLLRAVNVGGKNLVPMKEFKSLLENKGVQNISTYIQSGNIVLQSESSPTQLIQEVIESEFGFMPQVLVLSESEFKQSIENNPFSEGEGKFIHFYYCQDHPAINNEKLQKYCSETEHYQLVGKVFYLHAPSGIGRSKLVANIESCLGVPATGRNLNTVNKIESMLNID